MTVEYEELQQLLLDLGDERKHIAASGLHCLSDLAGSRLDQFKAAWEGFSTETRRRLLRDLAELADANFSVSFDAIYRFCLDDDDEEVRVVSVDGLWENESTGLVGPFLTLLHGDPSPSVRAAAASGLGRFVLAGELEQIEAAIQNRIVSELLTLIHNPGESAEVRRRAVESVAYACTADVHDVLEAAYYDADEAMRISAVVGMGRSCDRSWEPLLLEELRSTSAAMRYEAAMACGELALKRAVEALESLIRDPDRQVSDAAIWSLGQIGGVRAKKALIDAYQDADEDTEAAIDDALAEHALAEGELDFPLYDLQEEDGNSESWNESASPDDDDEDREDPDLEDW